jgi:membrane-bound lytic murein transglycosylase A
VFFTQIDGNPRGSLNVEVSPQRTLATDKTLFPRGALVYVDATLPLPAAAGRRGQAPFRQLMLDQDTGGAIRTAGRADIYLGIGPQAEQRAGATRSEGQLYYLFLEE